eukprot:3008675-Amphidinium_carterae.1
MARAAAACQETSIHAMLGFLRLGKFMDVPSRRPHPLTLSRNGLAATCLTFVSTSEWCSRAGERAQQD